MSTTHHWFAEVNLRCNEQCHRLSPVLEINESPQILDRLRGKILILSFSVSLKVFICFSPTDEGDSRRKTRFL